MALYFKDNQLCGLPLVTRDEFVSMVQPGDGLWVSGVSPLDDAIKFETKSTLTHVAFLYRDLLTNVIMVLESQGMVNTRIVSLNYYLKQKGALFLGRTNNFTETNLVNGLLTGFACLGDSYNYSEIIEIAAHNAFPAIPVDTNRSRYICSELFAKIRQGAGLPLQPAIGGNTPASTWLDPSITGICGIIL